MYEVSFAIRDFQSPWHHQNGCRVLARFFDTWSVTNSGNHSSSYRYFHSCAGRWKWVQICLAGWHQLCKSMPKFPKLSCPAGWMCACLFRIFMFDIRIVIIMHVVIRIMAIIVVTVKRLGGMICSVDNPYSMESAGCFTTLGKLPKWVFLRS